jgi:hypothetical protein
MLTDEAARQIINAHAGDIGGDPEAAMLLLVRLGYSQALKDAAEVAGRYASRFDQTREAHYRLTSDPFIPERFGFLRECVEQSRGTAAAILALGKEKP